MSNEASILVERTAGIAQVSMNRPERHNAFDDTFIAELTGILKDLERDQSVRVVVLGGNGKSFSAGADLNWMQRMAGYTREQNEADALALAELMETLDGLGKPTIAKVHGAAFGGGVGLVACCDIAIASENATFCLSEVKLGLIPAAISPYVVKAMGEQHARRYFVTAERFGSAEAVRIGLVHEHVAAASLDARVEELLAQMRGNGPEAMAAAKDLARAVGRGPVNRAMIEDTARRIAIIRVGDEGQEGMSAFLEKRKPAWLQE
ncbi:enoyl-CoA hydratase/isomerase family protein [Aquisalimonas sp. 2447]|uniref:enoyl-CoA hydratase/isomerase family protein n=1 Tax=Aquisalimonas sp. 2447 TaxID=2740807 RepID=UPI00143244F4|nr:enoyl-CoA hydratase/isomerase family protein [Aquisalimonas sp. 2447]QIT55799.1 enoyl-CoA hydratase/isomerase family protein [Aquisalimonas sp. 2447]